MLSAASRDARLLVASLAQPELVALANAIVACPMSTAARDARPRAAVDALPASLAVAQGLFCALAMAAAITNADRVLATVSLEPRQAFASAVAGANAVAGAVERAQLLQTARRAPPPSVAVAAVMRTRAMPCAVLVAVIVLACVTNPTELADAVAVVTNAMLVAVVGAKGDVAPLSRPTWLTVAHGRRAPPVIALDALRATDLCTLAPDVAVLAITIASLDL